MKYKFYVTDWNTNGTNALIVRDAETLEVIDARDEVLFGVDVTKLRAGVVEFEPECLEYRIPQRLIKRHVATAPFGGMFQSNCAWHSQYLSKGGSK